MPEGGRVAVCVESCRLVVSSERVSTSLFKQFGSQWQGPSSSNTIRDPTFANGYATKVCGLRNTMALTSPFERLLYGFTITPIQWDTSS
jgi:hypothetical protein